ncbi:MAG: polyprenyl synthetase family protein [Clostridiales bacterium]|nr:polyprenyl synthetase family protein [Clostridiales bacterium]
MNYEAQYAAYKQQVEEALSALPMTGAPDKLKEAMRYSLLSGGKRLRGILALAAAEMAGGQREAVLPFACAAEMIHAYSLIHDDLPAMDNDTLRRGKPTNHVVYGEALAILAGDGLLTNAFEVMAASPHPKAMAALAEMARAAGVGGMLAGQTLDVTMAGSEPDMDLVRDIHQGKTAAMLTAPVTAGLILAGAHDAQIEAGRRFGYHLGMAFQIVDDLLDIEGDPALMGKTLGKDEEEGKLTWPACVGVSWARQDAEDHIRHAQNALAVFGSKADFLIALADATLHREQ